MFTTADIITLARQSRIPFGAHAFIVVQENGGFYAEASYSVQEPATPETVAKARKDAEEIAAYRKSRQPEWDFHVLEVGKPVDGADLIASMADMIDNSIEDHIYDTSNGDEIPDDCPYTAIVAEARAWMAAQAPFSVPPIGALEIIADLRGSLSELDQQINQMQGMFDDSDGAIQQAQEEASEALHRARVYCDAVGAGPVQLFVKVEGGSVQTVTCAQDVPGLEVTVIDYDVTDEDEAVVEVHVEGDRWETARADKFGIEVEAAPDMREPAEQEG